MNIDREIAGLEPIVKEEMIMIKKDEYKNLLITQGKYEELKKAYYELGQAIKNSFKK